MISDTSTKVPDSLSFIEAMIGDGRPLIMMTGLCLALSGAFALFQSATGHFLPHDTAFLQMAPQELCAINECRIVHFMFHDRVSFGGALLAIAVLYWWLSLFPLKAGEPWSWWTLALSGAVGFGSFLTYLGYGYLDTWHGAATLGLLPCFTVGLWKSRSLILTNSNHSWFDPSPQAFGSLIWIWSWNCRAYLGSALLFITAIGMLGAGLTIQTIGMTKVFVDTDLVYMGLSRNQLDAINPRLVPLIAHDRAGFGGAVATAGILLLLSLWFATPSRSFWQALFIAGVFGWSTSIGVHPLIGYNDAFHLAPAVTGALFYFSGLGLARRSIYRRVSVQ